MEFVGQVDTEGKRELYGKACCARGTVAQGYEAVYRQVVDASR